MAGASCEWLEGFSTEYLVKSVHALKAELLRRGLDECGLKMPLLSAGLAAPHGLEARHVTAAERERARRLMDDHIDLVPVPRRPHHDCSCPRDLGFHLPGCGVADAIRQRARADGELEREYVETLRDRDRVVTIKVHGSVEVES